MTDNKKAYLFAFASVFLWSTVATAFKISLRHVSPIELLFFASITSCFVLTTILLISGKMNQFLSMGKAEWILSVKFGFLNPFFYYLILLYAYSLLPAQQAQAINYTWAITMSLLSIPLLKQRITFSEGVAVAIGYVGVLIIIFGKGIGSISASDFKGIGLAFFSTIIWSFYWIKNTSDTREPVAGLLANFICGLPFIVVYMLFEQGREGFSLPPIEGLLGSLYVGVFEMGLAFVSWLIAMKLTKDTVNIANLIFLAPILSLVLIYYLVGEKILLATIIGMVFILLGLALQIRAVAKK